MEPFILPFDDVVSGLHWATNALAFVLVLSAAGVAATLLNRRLNRRSRVAAGLGDEVAFVDADERDGSAERESHQPQQLQSGLHARPARTFGAVRLLLRTVMLAGLAGVGALIVFEFYGAETLLRWSFSRLQDRNQIQLTFESATGGPLRGGLVLHQVRAIRVNHAKSNFDLSVARVNLRFSLWNLLDKPERFDEVVIEQVTGTYEQIAKPDPKPSPSTPANRPVRNVILGRFQVLDLAIDFTDKSVEDETVKFELAVNRLESPHFRTGYAAYDCAFRSEIEGTLDRQPFRISSMETQTERVTEWQATAIPMKFLRVYLQGPFRLMADGTCDLRVVQTIQHDPTQPVTLDAKLGLHDLRFGIPGNVKPAVAIATQVLISQVKNIPKEKTITFNLKLDPTQFDLTRTEDQGRLWVQFREAATAGLLQTTGVATGEPGDSVDMAKVRAANVLTEEAFKVLKNIRDKRKAKKAEKQKGKDAAQEETNSEK